MFALQHRVRVFVFQVLEQEVQYLLLRQKPVTEWDLGPVVGAVDLGEKMNDAVVRQVELETGIRTPLHIIELAQPQKELFGDVGLVEWPYAYQAGTPTQPVQDLEPGPMIGEWAWWAFAEAYQKVGTGSDRDSLVRLQLRLASPGGGAP